MVEITENAQTLELVPLAVKEFLRVFAALLADFNLCAAAFFNFFKQIPDLLVVLAQYIKEQALPLTLSAALENHEIFLQLQFLSIYVVALDVTDDFFHLVLSRQDKDKF